MRIPDNIITRDSIININNLNTKLNDVRQSISTGQRVNSLSDDPQAMFKAMGYTSDLEDNTQYVKNVKSLETYSATVDSSFSVIDDTFLNIRSIASSNSIVTDTKLRPDQAAQVNTEIEKFLNQTNTQHEGNYIFSGTAVNTVPFTASYSGSNITSVKYNGNSDHQKRQIGDNIFLQYNTPGSDIIGGAQDDTNPFEVMISLRDNIQSGTVTSTGSINMPGSSITSATALNAGSPPFINAPVPGTVTINNINIDWTGAATVQDLVNSINGSAAGVTASFDSVRQKFLITPNDVTQPVKIQDVSGNFTQFTHTAGAPKTTQEFLGIIDKSFQNLVSIRTKTGIVGQRARETDNQLVSEQNTLKNSIHDQIGTDQAKAIVDMMAYENTLKGALSVTARIDSLKLMDFLQ